MKTLGITQVVKLLIQLAMSTAFIVAKPDFYFICMLVSILFVHVLYSSLVRIDNGTIKVIALNPFKKSLKANFSDINKITLARGATWGLGSNIVITTNSKSLRFYLNYDSEMDDLYKYLTENIDNVEFR